jgi:hypothetical protein
MTETPGQSLAATLRTAAQAFAAGDQVPPCAVLWTDPDRLWEAVIPQMQSLMPELYRLGPYLSGERSGPAMWLRCIEARVIDGAPPAGTTPIFYLPGISREQLRGVEDCSLEVAALVELQFRGVMWMHVNGKEWTPYGFLVSKLGGLALDVAKDLGTLDALARALPALMDEPTSHLRGRRLDADFFHGMLAPDANGLILRWLSDPDAFQKGRKDAEWQAFCQQCKADYKLDPVKDGPLKAAQRLASREHQWNKVWLRYAEGPASYPGVAEWLKRAAPKEPSMFDSAEVWPDMNRSEESQLAKALEALADLSPHEVIKEVTELEKKHAPRRNYVWQQLGQSPLATLLEPLARLARLCADSPGAPDAEAFAHYYAETGWQVDAAALETMAGCGTQGQTGGVPAVVRAIYLPWLEGTSRHLQKLVAAAGQAIPKRSGVIEAAPGRLVLFADGLRMDVAHQLADRLTETGLSATREWEWSTVPSVTATAKPAASPVADLLQGRDGPHEFSARFISTGQDWTQENFKSSLKARGWQFLTETETGDPTGSAWTEAGTLDRRGHDEGWKLARSIATEVRDLADRIGSLIAAGWQEVIVVTDHGWLLLPGGLPKVELKAFLTDDRWGRCASLKSAAPANTQVFPWHWDPSVAIASPPGAGCYRAGIEYSHGGISLQEMVTPRLSVGSQGTQTSQGTRIANLKWSNAKCRVTVSGNTGGLQVDLRTSLSDPATSLLANRKAAEVNADGKVTVFLDEDADIGRQAEMVLLSPSGQVLHSIPTTLGN